MLEIDTSLVAYRSPDYVDILIVHDREQPGANIGAGLPQVSFIDGAREGLLDEIVRSIRVPSERPRIATKSGNFLLDKAMKFNQRRIPQQSWRAMTRRLGCRCNLRMNETDKFGKIL